MATGIPTTSLNVDKQETEATLAGRRLCDVVIPTSNRPNDNQLLSDNKIDKRLFCSNRPTPHLIADILGGIPTETFRETSETQDRNGTTCTLPVDEHNLGRNSQLGFPIVPSFFANNLNIGRDPRFFSLTANLRRTELYPVLNRPVNGKLTKLLTNTFLLLMKCLASKCTI